MSGQVIRLSRSILSEQKQVLLSTKKYKYDKVFSSLIQTFTVGFGITPNQSFCKESRTFTAGREFRPAPKNTVVKIPNIYKIISRHNHIRSLLTTSWGNASGVSNTQAPTTPETPTASDVTSSTCSLTWTASTDNIAVTGYQILQNGSVVTITTGTSVTLSGLSANTTYSFTVKAYDAAGNYSAASSTVSVTTLAASTSYTWPSYNPTISYNFVDEYGPYQRVGRLLRCCRDNFV
jgi:hypothetical protein